MVFALTASNDASSTQIEKFVDEIHYALKRLSRQDLFLMKTRGCTIAQGCRFVSPEAQGEFFRRSKQCVKSTVRQLGVQLCYTITKTTKLIFCKHRLMVNDNLRKEIWNGLYDSVRCSRYYTALADRYQRYQTFTRLALLIVACGGIVAFFDLLPMQWYDRVEPIFGLLLAVIVFIDFSFDFGKKATELHVVSKECLDIENRYRTLWRHHLNLNNEAVEKKLVKLDGKLLQVTSTPGKFGVLNNSKLNNRCADSAYRILESEYAK